MKSEVILSAAVILRLDFAIPYSKKAHLLLDDFTAESVAYPQSPGQQTTFRELVSRCVTMDMNMRTFEGLVHRRICAIVNKDRIWASSLTVIFLVLLGQSSTLSADTTILYPGTDKSAVVSFLKQIRNGYLDAREPLENILIEGVVSHVNKPWKPDESFSASEPEFQPFTFVRKDGLIRYHQGVLQQLSTGVEQSEAFRIFAVDGMYRFDRRVLIISPKNPMGWMNDCFDFSIFERPHCDGIGWVDLVQYCDKYIDRIEAEHDEKLDRNLRQLRCTSDNGILIFEDVPGTANPNPDDAERYLISVDSSKGYGITRTLRQIGGVGRPTDISEVTTIEHAEIGPNIFYPSQAVQAAVVRGDLNDKDGQSGRVDRRLEVRSVSFGDFGYDMSKFKPESLPIPMGADVIDTRHDPPRQYVYGQPAIDERTLDLSAAAPMRSSGMPRMVWLNVAAVIVLVGITLARRRAAAS